MVILSNRTGVFPVSQPSIITMKSVPALWGLTSAPALVLFTGGARKDLKDLNVIFPEKIF